MKPKEKKVITVTQIYPDQFKEDLSFNERDRIVSQCEVCGNKTFYLFVGVIIDDARVFCTECGANYC